jgi:hypothetical protein
MAVLALVMYMSRWGDGILNAWEMPMDLQDLRVTIWTVSISGDGEHWPGDGRRRVDHQQCRNTISPAMLSWRSGSVSVNAGSRAGVTALPVCGMSSCEAKTNLQSSLGWIYSPLAVGIGPRGSTTEGERRGSEYCRSALAQLDLDPHVEPFISARSIFTPQLYTSLAMVAAFAIYPLAGRISAAIAALITVASLTSQILELSFRDHPLRRLIPKGPSQNVVATLSPSGAHRQDLILVGHVDTNRTPFIFSTSAWVDFFRIFHHHLLLVRLSGSCLYHRYTDTGILDLGCFQCHGCMLLVSRHHLLSW